MVQVTSHKRWYHGSSVLGAQTILAEGIIRPGMPTKYRKDIPREDAVYVTSDQRVAKTYAETGKVFEVEVDETKLIPDEDLVFELLAGPSSKDDEYGRMYSRVLAAWAKSNFGVYGDKRPITRKESAEYFVRLAEEGMADPFSTALAEEMKDFVEWIVRNDSKLAADLVDYGNTAAHLGPVRVIREVK